MQQTPQVLSPKTTIDPRANSQEIALPNTDTHSQHQLPSYAFIINKTVRTKKVICHVFDNETRMLIYRHPPTEIKYEQPKPGPEKKPEIQHSIQTNSDTTNTSNTAISTSAAFPGRTGSITSGSQNSEAIKDNRSDSMEAMAASAKTVADNMPTSHEHNAHIVSSHI